MNLPNALTLGRIFLDQLEPRHLLELQEKLLHDGLSRASVDRVVHSALRGMLRDAEKQSFNASGMGPSRIGPSALTRFLRKQALMTNTGACAPLAALGEPGPLR